MYIFSAVWQINSALWAGQGNPNPYDVASFGKCTLDFKPPTYKWGYLFIHSTVPTRCVRGKEVVLRATESRTDVFCVCFDRWERSRHLLEAAINYESLESPLSQPNELCELHKTSPFVFSFCSFHSFNSKFWEKIWILRFIIWFTKYIKPAKQLG